jgi:preprotein translocase subunit SecE
MSSIVTRTRDYSSEVWEELKKVTWPDASQLRNATFVILVFVVIVSAIIWLMDLGVRNLIGLIIGMFS